jgi:hypothetical protein
VSDEMLKESIQVITSIEDCTRTIEKYFNAGFTRVYVHSASPEKSNSSKFFEEGIAIFYDLQKITKREGKDIKNISRCLFSLFFTVRRP